MEVMFINSHVRSDSLISLSLSVSMPRSQSTLSIRVVPGMGIRLNPLDEEVTLACSDERVIKGRVLDVFPNVRAQPSPSILALFEPIFAPYANFGLVLEGVGDSGAYVEQHPSEEEGGTSKSGSRRNELQHRVGLHPAGRGKLTQKDGAICRPVLNPQSTCCCPWAISPR